MKNLFLTISTILILFSLSMVSSANKRLKDVKLRVTPVVTKKLDGLGAKLGDDIYLRAFKQEKEMEVWVRPSGKKEYKLYGKFDIAGNSGGLGPKLAEGDYQMPEGFYTVLAGGLNPNSRFHLSFNIGYPNSYDRYHKRTGSFIMVHGSNVSVGCYAMTDPVIEEIYLLVEADLKEGDKKVPFHSYPFRYSRNWEKKEGGSKWIPYWKHLEVAYDAFNKSKNPPKVSHSKGQYIISPQ